MFQFDTRVRCPHCTDHNDVAVEYDQGLDPVESTVRCNNTECKKLFTVMPPDIEVEGIDCTVEEFEDTQAIPECEDTYKGEEVEYGY